MLPLYALNIKTDHGKEINMSAMLSLNEKDFKDILDGLVDGVITINQQGNILSFNKAAETIFGYRREEVTGKNVSMLMPEPDSSKHDAYLRHHLTTGDAHIIGIGRDVTALRKNGETFSMRLSVIEYPAKIEGDRWFIGSCRDITLQKQQEEQLKRSQKMDAIGKITSGIAHDYNNMLGVIMGYSELLISLSEDKPKFLEYSQAIMNAATRASNLTQQLLSFSRKRDRSIESVDINEVLNSNYQIFAKTLTPRIRLRIAPGNDLWNIHVDKGAFEDVILNLVINAKHAMPHGGSLDIIASNIYLESIDSQILNIPTGQYVQIDICDTGTGMSDDVISHIFEPFYSTRGEKGTGLGLSQVYNFVKESEGTIQVMSKLGEGTRFSIYLPAYITEGTGNQVKTDKISDENILTGKARILVVDDEPAVMAITEKILSNNGYRVVCANSAKQALELLEGGESESIDLVLSDVIMPEIDGFELAHIIHYTYPDMKIQLCSGMSRARGKTVSNKILCEKVLEKPFTSEQLLSRIKTLLET